MKNKMKNIFLIPTDKESRLWRDLDSNKLRFDNISTPNSNECTKCSNEYVYITSDEKFVRDEYITDGLEVIKATPKLVDAQGLVDRRDWKKIVMTNDLELIEDGIQQIGDLFFRWFVLNPYCKEVEVVYGLFNPMGRQVDPNDLGQNHSKCVWKYKIITTKEEQKQHLIDMMKFDEELGLYDEKIEDIELEEVRGSSHCQFSVVENKLAIIYRNQLKILQAIKMLNNGNK